MKIWLDDKREPPDETWAWARDYKDAVALMECNKIDFVSFDHDLGRGRTGYDVACKVEELAHRGAIGRFGWDVHSQNPVGAVRIQSAMLAIDEIWNRRSGKG